MFYPEIGISIVNFQDLINLDSDKVQKKEKKLTSPAWAHFKTLPNCEEGMKKARCMYCKVIVSCNTREMVRFL